MLSSKEIAQRFAGQSVKCKVSKSVPVTDTNGNSLDSFDAKIVGWKSATLKEPSYVCVEVLPPATTPVPLSKFNLGYHYTADRNDNGYGKKLFPEEIILPASVEKIADVAPTQKAKRVIPEWPDKCRDCGNPAVIMSTCIDCSNPSCKNKYKTHSGLDLFLPVEMRPPGWDKDPFRKRRNGIDQEDFIVCDMCKSRANSGSFVSKDKLGAFKAICHKNHTWRFELNIGDKLASKDRVLVYKGKNIFVPSN